MTRVSTRELGTRPARVISWLNVISRFVRRWAGGVATKLPRPGSRGDQAVLGEPLHRVPRGHPADPELDAQLGVGRHALAGWQGEDPLAQRAARSAGSAAAGRRSRDTGVAGRRLARPGRRSVAGAAALVTHAGRLGAMDRRADRPGPRPQLGGHQVDLGRGRSCGPAGRARRGSARAAGRRRPRSRRR